MTSLREALEHALGCLRSGRLDEAAALCRRLLCEVPGDADILHFLGIALTRSPGGDPRPAVACLRRALWLNPALPGGDRSLHAAGTAAAAHAAAAATGRTGDAAALYTAALAAIPTSGESLFGLYILECGRNPATALACLRRLICLEPDNGTLMMEAVRAGVEKNIGYDPLPAARRAARLTPTTLLPAAVHAGLLLCRDPLTDGDRHRALTAIGDLPPYDSLSTEQDRFLYGYLSNLPTNPTVPPPPADPHPARTALGTVTGYRDARLAPLDPDDLPRIETAAGARAVFFCACDAVYAQRFGHIFLGSIARNAGVPAVAHMHIVNPDGACWDHLSAAALRHRNMERKNGGHPMSVVFSEEFIDVGRTLPALVPPPENTDRSIPRNREIVYYQCARFLLLPALRRLYRQPLIVSDVDTVVQQAVPPALAHLGDHDAAVNLASYAWNFGSRIIANILFLGTGPNAARFAGRTADYITARMGQDCFGNFLDQTALLMAGHDMRTAGEAFHPVPLPPTTVNNQVYRSYGKNDFMFFSIFGGTGPDLSALNGHY